MRSTPSAARWVNAHALLMRCPCACMHGRPCRAGAWYRGVPLSWRLLCSRPPPHARPEFCLRVAPRPPLVGGPCALPALPTSVCRGRFQADVASADCRVPGPFPYTPHPVFLPAAERVIRTEFYPGHCILCGRLSTLEIGCWPLSNVCLASLLSCEPNLEALVAECENSVKFLQQLMVAPPNTADSSDSAVRTLTRHSRLRQRAQVWTRQQLQRLFSPRRSMTDKTRGSTRCGWVDVQRSRPSNDTPMQTCHFCPACSMTAAATSGRTLHRQ